MHNSGGSELKRPVSEFEVEMHAKLRDEEIVPSRYEFLKAHNGLRPNCLHGMMGTMGSGKSTFLKCIIAETAQHVPVLVWLSEESVIEYQELINYIDKSSLKNIVFVEESELANEFKSDHETFTEKFEQLVVESGAKYVFIDNVTTSLFYNQKFGFVGQNKTADFLKSFVKRVCSVYYVAHTEAKITNNHNKMISPENVRGSKELPIVTEYFYIMQRFTSNGKIYNFLSTVKYRHHEKAEGHYALKYENRAYIGDAKVHFNLMNTLFKSRDYLGRALPKKKKSNDDIKTRDNSIIK